MSDVDAAPWIAMNADGCSVDDLSFCGAVEVTVAADTRWEEVVAASLAHGWLGLEWLSGLPGTVGEAVVGNHTAYGHSVGESVARVRTRDRSTGLQRTYAAADCALAPRTSRFLADPAGSAVLDVTFLLRQGDLSEPVRDEQFARMAGITLGERLPATRVRALVLAAAPA
ncbi:MAG: hypothetical protein U0Q21_11270 [Dermatophilaceae bacterium]